MSLFPRSNPREKIILPIRSNLKTYNEIPEHTILTENTSIPSELDGETVVARYRNLTIGSGVTLTTAYRCCGLVLVVDGDLTVNGTISMTARGANYHPAGDHIIRNSLLPANDVVYEIDIPCSAEEIAAFLKKEEKRYHSLEELPAIYRPTFYARTPSGLLYSGKDYGRIPIVGGSGGAAKTAAGNGNAGGAGSNRGCGGGGGGGKYNNNYSSGAGSDATCYSGGAGGGGCTGYNYANGGSGGDYGGAGGTGAGNSSYKAGGGAGNPKGSGTDSTTNGYDGTGGLLIIVCTGSIILGSSGKIEAKGSKGGGVSSNTYASGGGSGGGSINLFYGKEYSNLGSVLAIGGDPGTPSYWSGGKGGDGCITIDKYNF